MAGTALAFDRPEMNVDLAKQYLKENKDDIKNIKLSKNDEGECESVPAKREKLAKKIKENSKLICQLEYMTNKTPVEDSEKNIQLMLHYLSLSEKYRPTSKTYPVSSVPLLRNTPLALFIYAIEMGVLTVCEERSAVCHLLIKLCEEIGLLSSTFKVNFHSGDDKDLTNIPSCIGIVSERSDLDSAVDAFLTSTSSSNCFWRIRQIYVQESIFQSFKGLIDFKAKLKSTKSKEEHEELKKLSSDLFVYENKVLLFDYAGDVEALRLEAAHIIVVEAYRTTKELLTLIGEKADGCVSLWCADMAEANEIAYKIPASLVWINDYGNFDGPPEISTFLLNFAQKYISDEMEVPKRFIDSYEIWRSYDNKKRASIICDVLEELETSWFAVTGKNISNLKFNAVDVADGKICVTLDSPVGVYFDDNIEFNIDVVSSLVIGNGVMCRNILRLDELQRVGVPIWDIHAVDAISKKIRFSNFRYRTKVVITNFGTIFAN